jgi:hypothetical protein
VPKHKHAEDNIRANSVHPGVADAHIRPHRRSRSTAERMRLIPMRRAGEVDEVAYAIPFLASDESSYGSAPCPHRRCPEQDGDQSHSIPDNLVALFGAVGAWNCSAGNCGHTQQGSYCYG